MKKAPSAAAARSVNEGEDRLSSVLDTIMDGGPYVPD